MIVLHRPRVASPLNPLHIKHLNSVRRPPFNLAVCGDRLEDAHQTITFKPDDATTPLNFTDRAQALTLWVHLAVTLEPGQPYPVKRAKQLQVVKAEVPAIKDHAGRLKASPVCLFDHRLEVIVLGLSVTLLVKDAIVAGHMPVAISPQQSKQVDARNHRVVFTRPVARHQPDLLRLGLVQSRVVYDKETLVQADLALGFSPQRRGVRLKAMQEAGESIVGWCLLLIALYLSRFGRADSARRGDHKVDLVVVRTEIPSRGVEIR